MRKKHASKILLSISLYLLGRDILQFLDSIVEFPLGGVNVIVFILSFITVYFYYKKRRNKTVQHIFFAILVISIWNLLSKILIFVPYNAQSSLGIFLGIVGVFVIGLPAVVFITDRIDKFLSRNLV